MEYLTYTYNITIIILFTAAATGFLMLFFMRNEKHYLWLSALCVLFILDTAMIYMTKIFDDFSQFYNVHILNSATLKTLVSISIVFCILQVMKGILNRVIDLADHIVFMFYVLFLFLLPLMQTTPLHLWMYFTATQVVFIYLAIRGSQCLNNIEETYSFKTKKLVKLFFLICIGWNVAITIEDTIVIFFFDNISTIAMQIQQKNICEDLERVFYVLVGLYSIANIIFSVKQEPEEKLEIVDTEESITEDIVEEVSDSTKDLTEFFDKYELTKREREVLGLLYQGKTNQQISEELFITMGTVKIHIHNIYQKCGVERRSQMMNLMSK